MPLLLYQLQNYCFLSLLTYYWVAVRFVKKYVVTCRNAPDTISLENLTNDEVVDCRVSRL